MKQFTFEMTAFVSVDAETEEEAREALLACTDHEEDFDCNGCGVFFPLSSAPEPKLSDIYDYPDDMGE